MRLTKISLKPGVSKSDKSRIGINPNVAIVGGLRSQEGHPVKIKIDASSRKAGASEGEVVVLYFEPSSTQDLKSSGFPEG